jgi:hypothetical protein
MDVGGTLQPALRKAQRYIDKVPNADVGSTTPMREYESIKINEDDDWVPMM